MIKMKNEKECELRELETRIRKLEDENRNLYKVILYLATNQTKINLWRKKEKKFFNILKLGERVSDQRTNRKGEYVYGEEWEGWKVGRGEQEDATGKPQV